MVPAAAVEQTIADLLPHLDAGDILIDGGNSYYVDDIRRAKELAAKRIHYVDVGTSGGVWGLERGYCMMIGGEDDVVKHLDPIFATLAPGAGDMPRTPGREKLDGTAEQGYLHCGPNGAGHFVKMVHNGIEYGIMAAYAEGLGILRGANVGKQTGCDRRGDDAAARPRALPIRPQSARHRGGVAARQRDCVVVAGPDGGQPGERSRPLAVRRARFGFGRGPVDDQGGYRRGRAGAGSLRRALPALHLARRGGLSGQVALGDALRLRRTPGKTAGQDIGRLKESPMTNPQSDALVFFGATGDLAYKKIFPALQAMVKRGHLDVPVIGVAKAGWNLEQFRARAHDSLEKHGGVDAAAFDKLSGLLRYVDGDYADPATFQAIRKELDGAQRPAHYLAIPPLLFETVVEQLAKVGLRPGRSRHRREALRS